MFSLVLLPQLHKFNHGEPENLNHGMELAKDEIERGKGIESDLVFFWLDLHAVVHGGWNKAWLLACWPSSTTQMPRSAACSARPMQAWPAHLPSTAHGCLHLPCPLHRCLHLARPRATSACCMQPHTINASSQVARSGGKLWGGQVEDGWSVPTAALAVARRRPSRRWWQVPSQEEQETQVREKDKGRGIIIRSLRLMREKKQEKMEIEKKKRRETLESKFACRVSNIESHANWMLNLVKCTY